MDRIGSREDWVDMNVKTNKAFHGVHRRNIKWKERPICVPVSNTLTLEYLAAFLTVPV